MKIRNCDKITGISICKPTFWGNNCTESCPQKCYKNQCNHDNGDCVVCEVDYFGNNVRIIAQTLALINVLKRKDAILVKISILANGVIRHAHQIV